MVAGAKAHTLVPLCMAGKKDRPDHPAAKTPGVSVGGPPGVSCVDHLVRGL
jgi:hypothetical protein